MKTVNVHINFKQSLYFSRFNYEINAVLNTLNDITKAQDFYAAYKSEYESYVHEERDTSPPFQEQDALYLLNETLLCRVWDDFVLYLKQLILAAEMSQTELSQTKIRKIDELKFDSTQDTQDTIKSKLHDLKVCPKDQPQWDDFKKIKKLRDTYTHSHRMKDALVSLHKQTIQKNLNRPIITNKSLFAVAKSINEFAKRIDDEFLKNYPVFIKT